MQKITVEIEAKGYTGLNAENIEKALSHYFGSPTLGVSFSVKEAAQPSVQRAGLTPYDMTHFTWRGFWAHVRYFFGNSPRR